MMEWDNKELIGGQMFKYMLWKASTLSTSITIIQILQPSEAQKISIE